MSSISFKNKAGSFFGKSKESSTNIIIPPKSTATAKTSHLYGSRLSTPRASSATDNVKKKYEEIIIHKKGEGKEIKSSGYSKYDSTDVLSENIIVQPSIPVKKLIDIDNENPFREDSYDILSMRDIEIINTHSSQSENLINKKLVAEDERARYSYPPQKESSNGLHRQSSNPKNEGHSLAQMAADNKGLFDNLAGISTVATHPGKLVEELLASVLHELYKERGLGAAVWDILFGVKFEEGMNAENEVERIIEKWLGEPRLFAHAQEALNKLHAEVNDHNISDEEFHKHVKEAKKKAFIEALKRHFEEAAYSGARGAANGVVDAFINKLMEGYEPKKKEHAFMSTSENIIWDEESIDEEEKCISVVNAFAFALTGSTEIFKDEGFMGVVFRHGVKLLNQTVIEQLSPNSKEDNLYSTISKVLKDPDGVVSLLKEELKKVVDEVVNPVLEPMNQFANELTHTMRFVKQRLGIPVAPQLQPAVDSRTSRKNEELEDENHFQKTRINNEDGGSNIINDQDNDKPHNIMQFGGIGSKLMGFLTNIISGAAESVPPRAVNQMAKWLKWGVNYAKNNISRSEKIDNSILNDSEDKDYSGLDGLQELFSEQDPLFNGLINALDKIIANEGNPPFEAAQEIYKALKAFAKDVSDNGGLVTIDGFPFLSFLFDKNADFNATPTFDNAIAEMGKTPREILESKDSDDDSHDTVVSIHPFKKNMAKYIGARVTYEVIAGLKPKGNFYMDLFAKSRKNEELEENLFSALEKAHKKGKISTMRLWLTKFVYSFVQPMSKLLFDPFIDNGDKQAKSLRKKKIVEKTAEEFRGEVTNYAAGVVNAYEDIAKGLGDRSKNIDGAMMEKLKEPAYNGGRTIKERHLKAATTAIEDLGPGFTFANRYFKGLSRIKFADKSYFKVLNLPVAVLKFPFYLTGSIFLYPMQSIMTRVLKWGMKKAMEGVDLVDDVVEKSSAAFDNDLNLKRVKLQGIHDFLINMVAKGKHLEEVKEVDKSVISDGDKKKFRSVVANILLAMEYNNAETIPELQEIIKENRNFSKNAFSFLGIKVDVNKYVNKKIHESVVEKVVEGYKQAIDENLVAQQVNNIKKAMNGIFDRGKSADVKSLKEDINRLERENEALLEEAIKTFVKQAVDEELDTSGDKRLQKLARVTGTVKVKLAKYVKGQEGIQTLDLSNNAAQTNIVKLLSNAKLSRKSVTKIFLDQKNKKLNELHYQKFSELHVAYIKSLRALKKSPDRAHLQVAQDAFNILYQWQENIQIPKGTNISLLPEAVKIVKDIAKGGVRDQAKKKIESFMDLMFKQWNVAALANMGMTMYGDRRFPFQKGK